ncbi:MAG: hypothetical protein RLZZ126_1180 [Pseudomonadota bacterium]
MTRVQKKQINRFKPLSRRFALEPRMLFDGALPIAGRELVSDDIAKRVTEAPQAASDSFFVQAHESLLDTPFGSVEDSGLHTRSSSVQEVVFVDSALADLLPHVLAKDGRLVVLIDGASDGLGQMTSVLNGLRDVSTVHIFSHGSEGSLQLGGASLNVASLGAAQTASLVSWGQALTESADILVYGCNFGAGAQGAAGSALLAELTGADVASSTDLTGSRLLGADWELERRIGDIEADDVLDDSAQDAYSRLLVNIDIIANTNPVITAGPNAVLAGTVLNPIASPPGSVVGSTAVYQNVATVTNLAGYTGGVDLKGTITSVAQYDVNDTVEFLRTGTQPRVSLTGGADGAALTIHWELLRTGTSIPVTASFSLAINDLDGASSSRQIESVTASTGQGLTQYTVDNPTRLTIINLGTSVQAIGTASENGLPISAVRFSWAEVSSVDLLYSVAPGYSFRYFDMNGDSTTPYFTSPVVVPLGIDLDANNSTGATGNNYLGTYSASGAAVPIADADISFALAPPTYSSGTIVLTNAQVNDLLTVGTLPAGISATVNTGVA